MANTVRSDGFLLLSWWKGPRYTTHQYRAVLGEDGIEVRDGSGELVSVKYAATLDNRTVAAYIDGVGFIGGWKYPHRAMPFYVLVESINMGILYRDMNDLPQHPRGPWKRSGGDVNE